ncbi:very short patch repair endonuclease [Dysgonomonas termitidis]|uniref:Very short patch repair endonuclease n=1 Tax=Dysgonomonas termitidis TaxID=1516126 RepID=A0ABV9KY03_9BACT
MTDIHSKETRSYNMSQVKARDTKPELIVRRFLFSNKLRYRLYDKKLQGKPDIVLRKYKTIIFIHGCFWHGHENCKYSALPKTRTEFWSDKIESNKKRDKKNIDQLKSDDWNVLIVYECELRKGRQEHTLNNILSNIQNQF